MFYNKKNSLNSFSVRNRKLYLFVRDSRFYGFSQYLNYLNWWFFRIICILAIFPVCYFVLRVFTYATEFGTVWSFFELMFGGVKLVLSNSCAMVMELTIKQFDFIRVTVQKLFLRAWKDHPEHDVLLNVEENFMEDEMAEFTSSLYESENYSWVNESDFDVWSYRLIDVPSSYFKGSSLLYEGDMDGDVNIDEGEDD